MILAQLYMKVVLRFQIVLLRMVAVLKELLSALHVQYSTDIETVEYYWLDDLVDTITLNRNDTVTITWKDKKTE